MWKNCNIHLLPSNETPTKGDILLWKNGLLGIMPTNHYIGTKQYLYITDDSTPKEGDWYYFKAVDYIFQAIAFPLSCKDAKKIIATSDTSLEIKHPYSNDTRDMDFQYPQIPKQFLEYYISEFNAGRKIEKVLVEFEGKYNTNSDGEPIGFPVNGFQLKLSPTNEISIKPVEERMYDEKMYDEKQMMEFAALA